MKRHAWERSVTVDDDGLGWVNGTRADFIWHLFMMGFSVVDLAEGCSDGFMQTTDVEDAIRFGMRKTKKTALTKSAAKGGSDG